MKIINKKILITGAASGIGKSLVKVLYKENKVLAVDKDNIALQRLKEEFVTISCVPINLLEEGAVFNSVDLAEQWLGGIDLCFANAGLGYYDSWQQILPQQAKEIFTLNVLIPMEYAHLLKRKYPEQTPRLIITASAIAFWAIPGYSYYSASKAAIRQFAKGIWTEQDGKWLTLVHPVATKTSFFEKAGNGVPMAWPVQTADEVAKAIIQGVEAEKKEIFPSKLFWLSLQLNKLFLFIKPIYQSIELSKLKLYQRKSSTLSKTN
ncbi:SDR family NAD(P)-dependent oxidoreductase [Mongoliitalea daihaiensis]|uniref:SDR family NAD(P)-dependent oxidoreductase n=1 Tax=Mongoliitalea daihaiensis TaxID=2782006 RepID=UPI001F3A89FB|nr:SDR family NAD(P)-dependent oxidoreductase [Mongoliitalea daihaiensis]UJP65528.1 SDR family NAD(P)-dependent oxidoreductase [Mongoliitalea daihaiensis]